jgi:dihydrolipoamide dehydrogenase
MSEFDLAVVGAGPGGYVAAIRAAQLGMKVFVVDREKDLGGTCLRVGCIPSKALLESTELYARAKGDFAVHGIRVAPEFDLDAMMKRKESIVGQLTKGVASLFKKNKVASAQGIATLAAGPRLLVDGKAIDAKHILLATGAVPVALPGVAIDGDRIVDSTGALAFPEVPGELLVIGAGYIGLEIGSIWARLGAKVTVLEFLPRILPGTDDEIVRQAQRVLTRQGIAFELGVGVSGARVEGTRVVVTASGKKEGETRTWSGDRLLVAVGRRPNTDGLGLADAGVAVDEKGRVKVDDKFRTTAPGVYAIGDLIGGMMLAHKASEEGVAAVQIMAGLAGHVNYDAVPGVAYTDPEIAAVGKTEEQLKEAGIAYKKGTFPFLANGRAKALGAKEGLVKILADAKTDRILGAHILGPRAGELIAEVALAMEFGGSSEDLGTTCHAHPTLAEAVKEAALAVTGRALHI